MTSATTAAGPSRSTTHSSGTHPSTTTTSRSRPAQGRVSIELSPNPALGDEVPGGVVALGSTARMMWDANTGRSQVRSLPPLAPASTALECGGIDFRLDGRTVTASFQVDSRQEL